MHFAKPADFKFPQEKVLKVGRTEGGVTSIEGQVVNSRAPDVAIYLRTYLRAALAFIKAPLNGLRARVRRWSSRDNSR